MTNSLLLKMAIEIFDLPTKNGDFLQLCKRLPEGNHHISHEIPLKFHKIPLCPIKIP